MSDFSVTTLLAIYGATLSSVALGWNIYRDIADRGRLRLHCMISVVPGDSRYYLAFGITNIGTKPVVAKLIGGMLEDGHRFIAVDILKQSQRLKPGEEITEVSSNFSDIKDVKWYCIVTSTGKEFRFKGKGMRELKRSAAEKLGKSFTTI